jgi:hypothetical protein
VIRPEPHSPKINTWVFNQTQRFASPMPRQEKRTKSHVTFR